MWIELAEKRNQRSRTYQDSENLLKGTWSGTLAALHYESELDSSIYDAEVDMTPVRIDVPAFDGWRITQNGWHYALGKDLASHGDQDGWVGFGGRQGQHWLKFWLQRVGYLHWPTREWQDIGGAPDYDRANLSRETSTLTIGPNDDEVRVGSVVTWANIWNTPGGGELSVQWYPSGDRLKEDIVINQVGREWIEANRPPATPLSETWFGFVFRLDWSDIPKCVRGGVLQDLEGDFADDGESIELRDALDRLLGFMPVSDVRVPNKDPELEDSQPLRKRFWKDGDGNHYLLVGVRCDVLNEMAAGDLAFDPTYQVGADDDDAYEGGSGSFYDSTNDVYTRSYTAPTNSLYLCGGTRFTGVAVPQGATIITAYLSVYITTSADDPNLDIYGHAANDPADFADNANIISEVQRPRTTNSTNWTDTALGLGWKNSPSVVDVIGEIVDRGGWASGNAMVLLWIARTNQNWLQLYFAAYEYGSNDKGAKLYIEYTVPGGDIKQVAVVDWAKVKQIATVLETDIKQMATVDAN